MGALGDRIGRRRLLLAGAAAFGLASVLAAFSASAGMLIAARAVLGVAGATLAPSTLSLIRNMFLEPKQRKLAVSVWITSFSAGGAIGPLLGPSTSSSAITGTASRKTEPHQNAVAGISAAIAIGVAVMDAILLRRIGADTGP
jgi:MFS family permease